MISLGQYDSKPTIFGKRVIIKLEKRKILAKNPLKGLFGKSSFGEGLFGKKIDIQLYFGKGLFGFAGGLFGFGQGLFGFSRGYLVRGYLD